MKNKSIASTLVSMSLALVLLPFSVGQAQVAPQAKQEQSRIDTEMMSHQRAMDIVLARLQKDFQAVVSSKDFNGYVRDRAAVKTYKGDLNALGVIVGQHRQLAADYERWCSQAFTTDYQHWCGPDVKENSMAGHQQRMKGILFDLSSTFDAYVKEDDHSIEGGPNKIQDALDAHRDALNGFADAINEHEHAVSQMMPEADHEGAPSALLPDTISVLSPSGPDSLSLPEKR